MYMYMYMYVCTILGRKGLLRILRGSCPRNPHVYYQCHKSCGCTQYRFGTAVYSYLCTKWCTIWSQVPTHDSKG